MEIIDVVTIQDFENYIKERNYRLNNFEDAIMLSIWPFLYDYQLLFLLQSPIHPNDFECLRNSFYDKIKDRYSNHYPPVILKANDSGDFWAKSSFLNWKPVKDEKSGLIFWEEYEIDVWKKFDEMFSEVKDYVHLYRDVHVRIGSLLLKLNHLKEINSPSVRRFSRYGFYPNPGRNCDIIKESHYQIYDYYRQSSAETIDKIGINEFFRLET